MNRGRKRAVLRALGVSLLAIAVAIIFLSRVRTYRVKGAATSRLICNSRSCYIFVHEVRHGWRGDYRKDLGSVLWASVGGAVQPSDMKMQIRVFDISAKDVSMYLIRQKLDVIAVFDDSIYATGNGLWRWAGTHFVPVPPELRKHYDEAAGRRATGALQFDDYDGWYMKYSITGFGGPGHFEKIFQLDGQAVTIRTTNDGSNHERIEIRRGNHPPQEIWSMDYNPRKVERETYQKLFGTL